MHLSALASDGFLPFCCQLRGQVNKPVITECLGFSLAKFKMADRHFILFLHFHFGYSVVFGLLKFCYSVGRMELLLAEIWNMAVGGVSGEEFRSSGLKIYFKCQMPLRHQERD